MMWLRYFDVCGGVGLLLHLDIAQIKVEGV